MKSFLNNKFSLIILLLVAIVLGFGNNVFASFDFTFNEYTYSLPDISFIDGFDHYFITTIPSKARFTLYYFNMLDFSSCTLTEDGNRITFNPCSVTYCSYVYYPSEHESGWQLNEAVQTRSMQSLATNPIIFANFELKDYNGNVVFQGAPQVEPVAEKTNLATIVEQAETEKTLVEIVGILPVVMIILVSIIAIRKAINFLRNVLKTS